ncbi:PTS sugar transporter subunit IIA [Clostridium sp. D2Q-14]|uniref:PTS galactosamine/N-acetylgalactosamine transporter subunit IIA n=1 Tax=Anaeromonas gelatinilytica TaxID=2683194 RepID=UPI00193B7405|nr:PTS galactosamine/N-acetylgalactosamine transporter subunit IIA [Anaeromonas gelatinilytica]MBS4535759.1 PTS sugar transporter subunit IIA [Anaeromonas gelatinilytica]
MTGIIIAGHGNFASGMYSVIKLVAGEQENLEVVDFLEGDSTEDLKEKMIKELDKINEEECLFFTDIPGGSPFKTAVEISMEREGCEVISGSNVPMIMEILFDRDGSNIEELKERAMETGKNQIKSFELRKNRDKKENIDEGI